MFSLEIVVFLISIFKIVPKGLLNCPLSTVHCQLGRQPDKHQFIDLLFPGVCSVLLFCFYRFNVLNIFLLIFSIVFS